MPPIRRYLRISKYSVLECRIYLENPSDTRWLLDSRDPVLPRIFASIRPLILPKLREENERLISRKKGKPVKDVIAEDDFEVALFLRDSRTRHSLLTRQKTFQEADDGESGKAPLTGAGTAESGILVESDDEDEVQQLGDIPQASESEEIETRAKRQWQAEDSPETRRSSKRRKGKDPEQGAGDDEDGTEDKKLGFKTNYESFNIYGWILCLLVTRKGEKGRGRVTALEPDRQALMEEWMSTQAQGDVDEE